MSTKNPFDPAHMTDNVKEQAQQIWLAGLGAFSKAQQEGTKAFEKLVTDGMTMQRKVQQTAAEKLGRAQPERARHRPMGQVRKHLRRPRSQSPAPHGHALRTRPPRPPSAYRRIRGTAWRQSYSD